MARVNVEQKALTDPRFYRLGLDLGAEPKHAHAVGLFAMVRVWNECIERGKYTLEGWVIRATLGDEQAVDHIVNSDLGTRAGNDRLRLRGTKGRIEYLEEKRRNGQKYGHLGAEHGNKGGRPKKTPSEGFENPVKGFHENPPPAPAPAPAPAQIQEENKSARAADRFAEFWAEYPRKEAKGAAERAWGKIDPTPELFAAIMAAVRSQKIHGCLEPRSDANGRSFIPHPSTWLNAKRWEDTPPPAGAGPARMDARTAYAVDTLRDCFEEPNP